MYVVHIMAEGTPEEKLKKVFYALNGGFWFSSHIAALATMDQYNAFRLEELTDEEYVTGNFNLWGVSKLRYDGLVTTYSE